MDPDKIEELITDKTVAVIPVHVYGNIADTEKIEAIAQGTTKTEINFNESFALTLKVMDKEKEIMNSMKEQSQGGKQVIEAVKDIASSTDKVKYGSTELMSSSSTIKNQMQSLTSLSTEVSQNIQNIANGLIEFEKSIKNVDSLANDTKSNIANLKGELDKFKTR